MIPNSKPGNGVGFIEFYDDKGNYGGTAFMLMAIGFCVQLILVGIGLALRTHH